MTTTIVANFVGVGVDALTYDEMFAKIDEWLKDKTGRSHHIACLNAYCAASALRDKRLSRIYNGADIAGADGMPFVWWIRRILGARCDRLAGPDILLQLVKRSERTGYTFYLYGGAPEVSESMQRNLERDFPYIRIVGRMAPPFRPLTAAEDAAVVDEINRLKPDFVLVGLGTPKQDYWIEDHLYKIRGAVLVASGAAFDFVGGRIKMAPEFIRRSGFEWLYRLLGPDFVRLFRRYTISNVAFAWNFALQLIGLRHSYAERWRRPDELPPT